MRSLFIALCFSAIASAQHLDPCASPDPHACITLASNYLNTVCSPKNSSGAPDFNAPCNAFTAISYQCIYGAAGLQAVVSGSQSSLASQANSIPAFSNASQQACICQSQLFDQWQGCADCYKAHGDPSWEVGWVPSSVIQSFSSSYCAVNPTAAPTVGFAYANFMAVLDWAGNQTSGPDSFTDPIANSTAVSLYFTPKVTGTAAWVIAQATETVSSDASTASAMTGSVATSNGQIVATTPTQEATTAATTSSSKTSSGFGGQQTAALAGVIAVAGFAMLL